MLITAIVLVFFCMLISLFVGLYFLFFDQKNSKNLQKTRFLIRKKKVFRYFNQKNMYSAALQRRAHIGGHASLAFP